MSHSPVPLTGKAACGATTPMRWLLIFNCQAMGIARSIELLNSRITVEWYDPSSFEQNKEDITARLGSYHRMLIAPSVVSVQDTIPDAYKGAWHVPCLSFNGYTPDFCHFSTPSGPLQGPLGAGQSLIAYVAFRCGRSEQQTIDLFREDIYAALGYFDSWQQERDRLVSHFATYRLDIRQKFVDWSRNGPFMFTLPHPKIFCLRDIAKLILERAGLETSDTEMLPLDNLANGEVFPVYPEIASRLGVPGSYLFKRATTYKLLTLEEFVGASFHAYRHSAEATPFPMFETMFNRATAVIEAAT